ncbi:MAG: PAS domain S-box protein [Ignavibacteriaceae bacterium]
MKTLNTKNNIEVANYGYLEDLPVGIVVFDADYNITFLNELLIKFGVLRTDMELKKNVINILKDELFKDVSIGKELKDLKKGKRFEKILKNLSGIASGNVTILVKGAPLQREDSFAGGILVVEDIQILSDLKVDARIFDKEFFEDFIRKNNSLFIVADTQNRIKYLSGEEISFLKKEGKKEEPEILMPDFLKEEVWNRLEPGIVDATRVKKEIKLSFSLQSLGEERHYEIKIRVSESGREGVSHYRILFTNVSEMKTAIDSYEKIIEELNFYKVINEITSDAIVGLGEKGEILFWNSGADLLFGLKRSQVFGKNFGQIVKAYKEDFFLRIADEIKKGKSFTVKLNFENRKGQRRDAEFTFSMIKEEKETIIVRCTDISVKEENERYLRESEERFRNIVENTAELICNFDDQGKINFANASFINTLGYSDFEVKNKSILDFVEVTYKNENKFAIIDIINSDFNSIELPFVNKKGEIIYLLASFSSSGAGINDNLVISGIFINITEKKSAENELLMMRKVFEASNDGIAVELEDVFIMANDSFAKLYGYSGGAEITGLSVMSIIDKTDQEKVNQLANMGRLTMDVPAAYEALSVKKDGTKFFAELSVTRTEFINKNYAIVIARDITERKRTQLVIRDSEERYRSITENIEDFFYTAERVGSKLTFVFFTSAVEKITGYQQADFLTDRRLFFRIIFPDDFELVKNKIRDFLDNYYKNLDEFEYRIIKQDGSVIWVKNKVKAIRNDEGVIQKIYGLVGDISVHKKTVAEIKQTTENLKKLNDTKDRFISIISHDLRTPFSSILGFTDLVLHDNELSNDEIREYVKYIQESSQNMLTLVNSLLDWTRLQTGRIEFKPQKTEFSSVVKKAVVSMSGFAMQKGIELVNEIPDDRYVFIDGNLILQAINNLISNALKFTYQGGKITISSTQSSQPRFLEVCVTDTGVGIPEAKISKIFEVDSKFTTEGTGGEKGTGLGLSLVREIIEKHGGKIWVESKLKSGSSFKFLIPKASATILLVDDSNTDRILYSKILRNIIPDYEIMTAPGGEEALKLIREISPALVITDHNMPKMTGYDFITNLLNSDIKGKPPVIVLSDFLGKGERLAYDDIGITYAFEKPVNLNVFKDAIEKSLKRLTISAN